MEKEIFHKEFIESLDQNFDKYSDFFNCRFYTYPELRSLVFEISKCLILGFNRASITLTNNVLERLLKLALIYNTVGLGPKNTETWNDIFSEPNQKYSSLSLANSIELCLKESLISQEEKNFLYDVIRELMRNGFSHSDPNKILKNLPDAIPAYQVSITNSKEIKEINFNHKIIPAFQSIQMDKFANENAFEYFKFVFEIMKSIDERLKIKFNINR